MAVLFVAGFFALAGIVYLAFTVGSRSRNLPPGRISWQKVAGVKAYCNRPTNDSLIGKFTSNASKACSSAVSIKT
jgi:hypothetical protein